MASLDAMTTVETKPGWDRVLAAQITPVVPIGPSPRRNLDLAEARVFVWICWGGEKRARRR